MEWNRLEAERYREQIQKILQKAISQPNTPRADISEAKGYLWLVQGDLEMAVQEWTKTLAERPADADLGARLRALRERWGDQRRLEKAEHETQLGLGHFKMGRFEEAQKNFTKALELNPGQAEAVRYLALAQEGLKKVSLAEQVQNLLIAGRRHEEDGRMLDAVQSYVEILTLEPANVTAKTYLERAKRRLYDRQEIGPAPAPGTSEGDRKKADELYTLGLITYSDGEMKKAEELFTQALRLNPSLRKAQRALEHIRVETGE
jgi:tetratricopeptide (TPR) repeat protein